METRKVMVGPRGNTKHISNEDEFMDVVAAPAPARSPVPGGRHSSNSLIGDSTAGGNPLTADPAGHHNSAGLGLAGRNLRWVQNSSNYHRAAILNPGRTGYNARFDQEKLAKYYWWLQCCEVHGKESTRTYLDIYDNHVELNRVSSSPCGCCCHSDHPRYAALDRKKWFSSPAYKARCCKPCCPFPCIHCFNCCGEVMVFDGGCCRRADTDLAPGFYWWTNCLCSVAAVYGLADGGAQEACDAVNRNVDVVVKGNMFMR